MRGFVAALLLLVLDVSLASAKNEAFSPRERAAVERVEKVHELAVLLSDADKLTGAELAVTGRQFRSLFDLDSIARQVMGEYWLRATADERADSLDLLSDIIALAVKRADAHRADRVEVRGVAALNAVDLIVLTRVRLSDGRVIAVDWRLREEGREFLLTDIAVDGLSLVAKYREEVLGDIRRRGESIRASIVGLRERVPAPAF